MSSLNKVCCIIDLAGFDIRVSNNGGVSYRNKFFARELACVQIDSEREFDPISYRFDLRKEIDLNRLTPDVHKTLRFQSQKLVCLPVLPGRNEVTRDYAELEDAVRHMYESCCQPGLDVVAYKGGSKEKELLDSLGIPSMDLGRFGCKTYLKLVKEKDVYSILKSCGNHTNSRDPVQCSMAEVIAYRDWYMRNYKPNDGGMPEDDAYDDDW